MLTSSPATASGCGRRHETPGSEMKSSLLLTAIATVRVSAGLCQFLEPQSHRATWWGPDDTSTHSRLHSRRGILNLGRLKLLRRAVGMGTWPTGRQHLWFPGSLSTQTSMKDSPEKEQSVPHWQDLQKFERPRKLSSNRRIKSKFK